MLSSGLAGVHGRRPPSASLSERGGAATARERAKDVRDDGSASGSRSEKKLGEATGGRGLGERGPLRSHGRPRRLPGPAARAPRPALTIFRLTGPLRGGKFCERAQPKPRLDDAGRKFTSKATCPRRLPPGRAAERQSRKAKSSALFARSSTDPALT